MGQQNWEIVLSYLYKTEGEISYRKGKNLPEKFEIVQETSVSPIELENMLEHMENIGLVDYDVKSYEVVTGNPKEITREFNKYSLSSKGFEVAHDREIKKSEPKHKLLFNGFNIYIGINSFNTSCFVGSYFGWI